MKKLLALLLATVTLITVISGCGKKDTASSASQIKHSVDVEKLAKSGRIPEVDFVLGDPVEGVKDALFKKASGMTYQEYCDQIKAAGHTPGKDEYSAYVISSVSDGHTILSANYDNYNSVYCMYSTENEKGGIAAIAVVGDAYGFTGNTLSGYVKKCISAKGTLSDSQSTLAFLPKATDGAKCLTYDFGLYKLEFYFSVYDTLAATVLYNTELW